MAPSVRSGSNPTASPTNDEGLLPPALVSKAAGPLSANLSRSDERLQGLSELGPRRQGPSLELNHMR
jgi:hypothetical protein